MEYNEDKVRKISSEVLAAIANLEDLQKLSDKEFISDAHKKGSAKYSLIVAIEGAVDLCNHLSCKRASCSFDRYTSFQMIINIICLLTFKRIKGTNRSILIEQRQKVNN